MIRNPYEVIVKPVNTEKSNIAIGYGKYTFEVALDANKLEIAEAISAIFEVDVVQVNVIKSIAKFGRWGRKRVKRKPSTKKAIVTLVPGQRIDAFDR